MKTTLRTRTAGCGAVASAVGRVIRPAACRVMGPGHTPRYRAARGCGASAAATRIEGVAVQPTPGGRSASSTWASGVRSCWPGCANRWPRVPTRCSPRSPTSCAPARRRPAPMTRHSPRVTRNRRRRSLGAVRAFRHVDRRSPRPPCSARRSTSRCPGWPSKRGSRPMPPPPGSCGPSCGAGQANHALKQATNKPLPPDARPCCARPARWPRPGHQRHGLA